MARWIHYFSRSRFYDSRPSRRRRHYDSHAGYKREVGLSLPPNKKLLREVAFYYVMILLENT